MPSMLRLIDRPGFIDDLEVNKESSARSITYTKICNIINYLNSYTRPICPWTRWSGDQRIEDLEIAFPTDIERHTSAYGGALSNHYITILIGIRRESVVTPASTSTITLTATSTSDAVTIYPHTDVTGEGTVYNELILPYMVTWAFVTLRTTAAVSELITISGTTGISLDGYAAWMLPPQNGGDIRPDSLGYVPLRYETNYDSTATDPFKFNPRHFYTSETVYSNSSSNATIYDLDTAVSRFASNYSAKYFPRQTILYVSGGHDETLGTLSSNFYTIPLLPDDFRVLPTEGIYLPRSWLNQDTNSTYRVCVGAVKARTNTGTGKIRFRTNTNTSANVAVDSTWRWLPFEIGGTYNTSNAGIVFRAPKAETIIYLEASCDTAVTTQLLQVSQIVIWENRLDNA